MVRVTNDVVCGRVEDIGEECLCLSVIYDTWAVILWKSKAILWLLNGETVSKCCWVMNTAEEMSIN